MKYRIKWAYGEYHLQTPPCTSSDWDTQASSGWRWPLHLIAWYKGMIHRRLHRLDGYKEEFGND